MASFGREQHEDDFLDQQQPGQGGGRFTSDDDGDFLDQQQHLDQGDPFTASLTEAIRRYTHDGFHGPDGSYSDHYYASEFDLAGGGGGVHFAEDEGDAYEDGYNGHYSFPALPAAASEAAIAALEAAEAPADDCCAVCLLQAAAADDDGGGAAPWSRLAPCGHRFHPACVGEWLRVKLSCPVCRRPAATGAPAPAPAAACRDAPEPPRPVPGIVDEMLAMSLEESVMFENSARWLALLADPYGFSAGNSS
ncbi:hypothetical protein BS78_10G036000 [Paspalum vaginatum]|nr:hypothetical protein BS78_10G036000 [Paspalum vaginatum]